MIKLPHHPNFSQTIFLFLQASFTVTMATPLKRKAADVATSSSKKQATLNTFFGTPKVPSSSPFSVKSDSKDDPKSSPPDSTSGEPQPPSSTNTVSAFSSLGAPAATQKFDKKAWVEKLTDEQKDLLKLEIHSLHESWLAQLKDEVLSKEFLELKRFLKNEKEAGKTIFPPPEDVYSWYLHSPSQALSLFPRCMSSSLSPVQVSPYPS